MEDGFEKPQSDDDKRYQEKDQKRAPEASSPYDMKERSNKDGSPRQVTTYDEHGDRHKQYDLKDGRREEHQHSFEYNKDTPRPGGKRSGHQKIN
jgi:hypothetical protein